MKILDLKQNNSESRIRQINNTKLSGIKLIFNTRLLSVLSLISMFGSSYLHAEGLGKVSSCERDRFGICKVDDDFKAGNWTIKDKIDRDKHDEKKATKGVISGNNDTVKEDREQFLKFQQEERNNRRREEEQIRNNEQNQRFRERQEEASLRTGDLAEQLRDKEERARYNAEIRRQNDQIRANAFNVRFGDGFDINTIRSDDYSANWDENNLYKDSRLSNEAERARIARDSRDKSYLRGDPNNTPLSFNEIRYQDRQLNYQDSFDLSPSSIEKALIQDRRNAFSEMNQK